MSKRTIHTYFSSSSASTPHTNEGTSQSKKPRAEFSQSDLIGDPGKRKPIDDYQPKIRDQLKRAYALNGPTQPRDIIFPPYCLYCYLFFNSAKPEKFGSSVFAHQGYVNWKKAKDTFNNHNVCKTHVEARLKCEDFMNQKTNVGRKLVQISKEEEKRYEIRLTASLGVARFLIMQGDAFRGHDESSTSLNKGTYREMIDWYKDKVEIVKEAYEKGSKNCQMLSPDIQKDLTKACAEEVTSVIMDEIRGKKFSVLIDESRDVSIKEQMAVILRFVNDEGKVMERFLGLQHVQSCTAIALKEALVRMLSSHNLSISMLRGQGYDGASNMRGEFNGVQKLIRDENPYAFYVHCFAHQLQLVVVTDALLAKHHDVLLEKIENGEIMTGRDVLEIVKKDSIKPACNGGALGLIGKMESFDFVFILHLMIELLSMTDILSRALQRKDQDIVEAMHLIMDVKDGLQDMRENGWEPLLKKVKTFCERNEIEVSDMDDEINVRGTSRRRKQKVTNMHYYHVEIFLVAIDAILTELNHRFSETSSELLVCMACFNPRKSFSNFDVDKFVRLAEIYAEDFDIGDLTVLPNELKSFVNRARRTPEFLGCTELGKVAEIMVKTNMNTSYQRVYRLIELTLILPVATASVERIFSAMSIIKTDLRSKMGDEWLNDLMICYNEKEIFRKICNEKIKKRLLLRMNNGCHRRAASISFVIWLFGMDKPHSLIFMLYFVFFIVHRCFNIRLLQTIIFVFREVS
ncbi:hypothetical protein PVAP13_3KG538480 [Panicum virgatum]|uniref:TTF-type domain-containing protein n=1 Tax=Panicum virgatum TaxID=38727 RepID=A0A8T0VFV0_PANVG|nr:hypothetical protein PVAP13_3KG538480 [Panicum virgatum]